MNTILVAGGIGFLVSLVVTALFRKFNKSENANNLLQMVISGVITAAFIVGANMFIIPAIKSNDYKAELDSKLSSFEKQGMPFFSYLKEHDPDSYNKFVDDYAEKIGRNQFENTEEADLYAFYEGQKLSAATLATTSPELLIQYARNLNNVYREINSINPDSACRVLFPQVFGFLQNYEVYFAIMKKHHVYEGLEQMIILKKEKTFSFNRVDAMVELEVFRSNFATQYPQQVSLMSNLNEDAKSYSIEQKRELIQAVILFQDTILKQDPEKSVLILRALNCSAL